jgi:arylsulfatase
MALGLGYDRFYGFIGGETNQWYPDLAEDNHYIDQPYGPEDGYHLSKDLADKAIASIRDSKQSEPDKPWYLWFCPGANHAPHHAPQEYIDRYKGRFDDGYEAYREWVLPRMIERGLLPEGTELTPINPMAEGTFAPPDAVRPWDTLSGEEKALFSRMAEVYAGFSEYTDAQVGRIVDYLEESGQLENTIVFYCADNGASGEGSPNGSVNENKFFNGWPDDIEQNLAMIDQLGSPATYNRCDDPGGGRGEGLTLDSAGCMPWFRTCRPEPRPPRWSSRGRGLGLTLGSTGLVPARRSVGPRLWPRDASAVATWA